MSWVQSGHQVVNFFYLVGVSVSVKQLKDIAVYTLGWGIRTFPEAALLVLLIVCFSLVLHLLPN